MCQDNVPTVHIKLPYENSDVNAKRKEYYFKPPGFLHSRLVESVNDQRDLPIAYLFFNIFAITIPSAAFVFYAGSNWVGFFYWLINLLLFHERFILGFHYSSHRGLFKNSVVNSIAPLILSPFFGIPSGIYYIHHCVMHHSENNLTEWDLSSTEPYQRDNFFHFLHYWLRFLCAIWVELPYYAWKRRRYNMAAGAAVAIAFFWVALFLLSRLSPCGAFWVFGFPTLAGSFLLMLGNWSQHIFINPAHPRSNYHLTYNVINSDFNQRTFNDGYHVEHHVHSKRHWTELPTNFMANVGKYAEEDAVVFQGIDFILVGLLVFFRQYSMLGRHLVQLREPARSPAEVEAFLRARLVPIRGAAVKAE